MTRLARSSLHLSTMLACLLLAACASPKEPVGPDRCHPRRDGAQCITQPARPLSVLGANTPVTVRVDARCEWNPTGVILERGAHYDIAVTRHLEKWSDSWQAESSLESGWPRMFAWSGRQVQRWARAPQYPMYALIGAQGREERTYFVVGERRPDFVAESGEELLFFANDWPGHYENNHGCVEVEIRKLGP